MTSPADASAWTKWRRTSRDERLTFVRALVLVPAMHVAVRIVGFNRLQQWVARTPVRSQATPHTVRTCVVSINRVKRFSPVRGNCLSQSLALSRLLRGHGIAPTLQLGVRLVDARFDAHAWVEYDGRVLNDTQDVSTRFTPLSRSPISSGSSTAVVRTLTGNALTRQSRL